MIIQLNKTMPSTHIDLHPSDEAGNEIPAAVHFLSKDRTYHLSVNRSSLACKAGNETCLISAQLAKSALSGIREDCRLALVCPILTGEISST